MILRQYLGSDRLCGRDRAVDRQAEVLVAVALLASVTLTI